MSFKQLYESCFKNISLVNVSQQSNSAHECLTTLDKVVKNNNYVIFFIAQSRLPSFNETILSLQACLKSRRSKSSSSATSSPAKFKRLFGLKKSKKSGVTLEEANDCAVVIVDVDTAPIDMQIDKSIDFELFTLPYSSINYVTKGRLLRAFRSTQLPCLSVIDCHSLCLLTSQGRRMLIEDPNGDTFPWHDPPPITFSGPLLKSVKDKSGNKNINSINYSLLKPCVKAIYFGAKWCPPCRSLNKQLEFVYDKLHHHQGLPFEIIYCSLDRAETSFEEHFLSMPWLAFPFGSKYLNELTRLYEVNGIPSVILLDEENNLITRHGRSVLLSDANGKAFPWKAPSVYELNEFSVNRIADFPSIILFTEGTPEDIEFSIQLLKPFLPICSANNLKNDKSEDNLSKNSETTTQSLSNSESSLAESDPIAPPPNADHFQFFYTGEDPFCDYILESLNLGQAELPLIIIVDVLAGHMAICEKPDVSDAILADFINDYRNGCVNVAPLPYSNSPETRKVGGIPVNVIEHLICNQQQHNVTTK